MLAAAMFCARPGFGAPALTTIQDVLYKADGTRFNGMLSIAWTGFQSGDSSSIPTQQVEIDVVNGAFKVHLVPTTSASAGANYTVTYTSQGKYQFAEVWAVPLSSAPLRVRDVRVSSGSVVGTPPPVLTQILIGDVSGLSNELALRPLRGTGYAPSRAAVINSSGQVDGAAGGSSDCIHVDGSSGACGSAGGSGYAAYADGENPTGTVDGANRTFTLRFSPSPSASLALYRNGILQKQGLDYTLSGLTVTFVTGAVPQPGDVIAAFYRYGDPANPLAAFTGPQVICSSAGQSTSATALTPLGTCTIPGHVISVGDRIEIRFDYAHTGNSTGFNTLVQWGSTALLSRSFPATETVLSGRSSAAVAAGGTQTSTESWGAAAAYTITMGIPADDIANAITIRFSAQMAASTTDAIALREFTVVRYPAQSNP